MDRSLKISDSLKLPLDLITETVAILAKRGVGKTYTASVMTEEILKVGGHVIAIDPVGVWWGLRASASGEPEGGLQILILGGSHGDLPLNPASGRIVAELLINERLSCVLDLSLMSQEETAGFLAPFLDRLYQINREPLHLMVDEADAVAPQIPGRSEGAMLSAMDRIVRRGRARGLGVTLITQRPAVLSKNVLTQIELLIVMRLTSPNDRKAIDSWIQAHGTEDERKTVIESLAKLEVGEAWFWSPAWLSLLKRVQVRKRQTFDSSSTPKIGQTLTAPRSLASLDLGVLRERFSSAIEVAEENDPIHLRLKISNLQRELDHQRHLPEIERIEVPVLRDGEVDRLRRIADDMMSTGQELFLAAEKVYASLSIHPIEVKELSSSGFKMLPSGNIQQELVPIQLKTERSETLTDGRLTSPQKRILDALASFLAIGLREVARHNLAVWAGQSPASSGFGNNLGRLRTLSLIEYPRPGFVTLTEDGLILAKPSKIIHSRQDLHRAWLGRLPRPQSRILLQLLSNYPRPLSRLELADLSSQSANSSGFSNNLGALRSLGLIEYPARGFVIATQLLFPAVASA